MTMTVDDWRNDFRNVNRFEARPPMSTGENINANGAILTQGIVRQGFFQFPQTKLVWVSPADWPKIAPLQIAADYPFKAEMNDVVPKGELWYVGATDDLLGRVINFI